MLNKWKNSVTAEEEQEVEKAIAEQKNSQYREIPTGTYPVVVEKMEVGESSWGTDQINISFKVIEDDFEGQFIFYNGTFDEHFAHGINQTAKLIADLLDGEMTPGVIGAILNHGKDEAAEFLADVMEEIESSGFSYDLNYQVTESKKINPNNNKPYVNRFYRIDGVFES